MRHKLFTGEETYLEVFSRQAIINEEIEFFTEECDDDNLTDDEVAYTFPSFVSAYFRIYNERLGRQLKNLVLTQDGDALVINASVLDMTFDDLGNYWYEIGYVQSGGYEVALMYGILKVV